MLSMIHHAIRSFLGVLLIAFLSVIFIPQESYGILWQRSLYMADLVDFSRTNVVTMNDFGFDNFSGNMGEINKNGQPYGKKELVCTIGNSCVQRFSWNFSIDNDSESYTGMYYSLFGLTDTLATFTLATTVSQPPAPVTVSFPEHSLDLDNVDGSFSREDGPRRYNPLYIVLKNGSSEEVNLKVELKDVNSGGRFTRFKLAPKIMQVLSWDFRNPGKYEVAGGQDLDIHAAKILSLVTEHSNTADGVANPDSGTLDIYLISFAIDPPEVKPQDDDHLLDLLEFRLAQYFQDWSSRKSQSLGIPQDRSTFGDLLTVGGTGFALPAYIISAERGWIGRKEAATRVLSVLRILGNPDAFGPEPEGRIGYKGWFYHFLGIDGRRKLNFDFKETPIDESLNTVELSTIDTGLALMGVLASQSYFNGADPNEVEIRTLAQQIYDRVEWDFMLEPQKKQFYLGWKPNEKREGNDYEISDISGYGKYSSKETGEPLTLDYYTDEALIDIILSAGSTTHPVSKGTYCALIRDIGPDGLTKTYPGSLFTYQFFHAFVDTKSLNLPACPGKAADDWYENSRNAILKAIEYAEYANQPPNGFKTYGANAWGISAAEGPADKYLAYGIPAIAVDANPPQDGTVTYYGMLNSISFGDDLKDRSIRALKYAWSRGDWHPRFGLPDAFNDDIAQAVDKNDPSFLRVNGPWIQPQLFSIDQGPMLLHIENYRSGLVWNLLQKNPNIQRVLNSFNAPQQILLETEDGGGSGKIMQRSQASGGKTVLLHSGESRFSSFTLNGDAKYDIKVRYSNDNYGPSETVTVSVDGTSVGQFTASDTGDYGNGWNVFVVNGSFHSGSLSRGSHTITLSVVGGDGYGLEIDRIEMNRIF